LQIELESVTQHETSSIVCLCLYSDGSSIRYSTVTLNYDLVTPKLFLLHYLLSSVLLRMSLFLSLATEDSLFCNIETFLDDLQGSMP